MNFSRLRPFVLSIFPKQLRFPMLILQILIKGSCCWRAQRTRLPGIGTPVNQEGRLIERFEFHLDISVRAVTDSGQVCVLLSGQVSCQDYGVSS